MIKHTPARIATAPRSGTPRSATSGRQPLLAAHPSARRGFTMVELLMVILIISILVALILPAINSVRANVLNAAIRTDISQFEQAIAQFKIQYGTEPPSRITLCEKGTDWAATDSETARSKAIIRRFWPQFDFTIDRELDNKTGQSVIALRTGECLTFFLAGIVSWSDANGDGVMNKGDQFVASGFSKNPANPFLPAGTGNRESPFLDFVSNRFVDTNNNGIPEYVDSYPNQETPLMYMSAYEGKGYDMADLATTSMISPYRYPLVGTTPAKYQKPQSYQIVSPGPDGQFGTGGAFNPDEPAPSFLLYPSVGAGPTYTPSEIADTVTPPRRAVEYDNITNFHPGKLKP